jgi:hypothetical protein
MQCILSRQGSGGTRRWYGVVKRAGVPEGEYGGERAEGGAEATEINQKQIRVYYVPNNVNASNIKELPTECLQFLSRHSSSLIRLPPPCSWCANLIDGLLMTCPYRPTAAVGDINNGPVEVELHAVKNTIAAMKEPYTASSHL